MTQSLYQNVKEIKKYTCTGYIKIIVTCKI